MPNSGSHDKFRIANFSSIIVNIVKMLGSLCLLAILPFYCKICMRNQLIVKIFKSMLAKSRFRPRGVNYIIKIFYDLGLTQPGASSTAFRTSPKTQQARGRCPLMSALSCTAKIYHPDSFTEFSRWRMCLPLQPNSFSIHSYDQSISSLEFFFIYIVKSYRIEDLYILMKWLSFIRAFHSSNLCCVWQMLGFGNTPWIISLLYHLLCSGFLF